MWIDCPSHWLGEAKPQVDSLHQGPVCINIFFAISLNQLLNKWLGLPVIWDVIVILLNDHLYQPTMWQASNRSAVVRILLVLNYQRTGQRTDGRMDGQTDGRRENIYPQQLGCVGGIMITLPQHQATLLIFFQYRIKTQKHTLMQEIKSIPYPGVLNQFHILGCFFFRFFWSLLVGVWWFFHYLMVSWHPSH